MTGFEVVVRPAILPNIRPPAPRILAPEDDPAVGIATLSGSGGALIDLTQSEQRSWSRSKAIETKRTFDVDRIYHKDDETGEIDKEQYLDTERLTKLTTLDGNGVETQTVFAKPPEKDNVEVVGSAEERLNDELPPGFEGEPPGGIPGTGARRRTTRSRKP